MKKLKIELVLAWAKFLTSIIWIILLCTILFAGLKIKVKDPDTDKVYFYLNINEDPCTEDQVFTHQ